MADSHNLRDRERWRTRGEIEPEIANRGAHICGGKRGGDPTSGWEVGFSSYQALSSSR